HGGMELHGRGPDYFEASRKHLAQGVMDRKRAAILNDDVAKFGKGPSLFEPEHFQRHVTDEPFRHSPSEIGKVGLGHLVIERFVRNGGMKQRIEAAVEIRQGFDPLAGTGRRQRQAQAKRGDDALASTKLHVLATSVQQRFGKHPLELVSDHAKLSMIHRGLLSWYPKPHAQEEFRMDHPKNPQENQILKSTYLCNILRGVHTRTDNKPLESNKSWSSLLRKTIIRDRKTKRILLIRNIRRKKRNCTLYNNA